MPEQPPDTREMSNMQIIWFIIVLSVVCALILSTLSSALKTPKEVARELDRSKQMLIAAKIFSHDGYFLLPTKEGGYQPAKYAGEGKLIPGSTVDLATQADILAVVKHRVIPLLVDDQGDLTTFEKAGLNETTYIANYRKTGYYKEPLKLIYKILPNPTDSTTRDEAYSYVIPVNGLGLWDAIYGYLAIKPDGVTVIGISWYDQKETPGLGANIAEADWQSLFPGKIIFQPAPSGDVDPATAPIGIVVVKGKVSETLGTIPKARSAVDGMAGATLTGNGVTNAYKDVLSAYRPFFIRLHKEPIQEKKVEEKP